MDNKKTRRSILLKYKLQAKQVVIFRRDGREKSEGGEHEVRPIGSRVALRGCNSHSLTRLFRVQLKKEGAGRNN